MLKKVLDFAVSRDVGFPVMAQTKEVHQVIGRELPERQVADKTNTVWHRRLKAIIDEQEPGTWVAVMEGSITYMRVYRSMFRRGDMNVPLKAVFQCDVIRAEHLPSNEGQLVFKYLGQADDVELAGRVTELQPTQFRSVWILSDEVQVQKPKPQTAAVPPKIGGPAWLKLEREGFEAWLEFEGSQGKSDDELQDMIEQWEAANGQSLTERDDESADDPGEGQVHPPLDVPEAAAPEEQAEVVVLESPDQEVPEASGSGMGADVDWGDEVDAGQTPVQSPDVADQPAHQEEVAPEVPDDGHRGEDSEAVDPSSGTVPEAEPAPLVLEPAPEVECILSPTGQHDYATLLQGAPPVCLYCEQEQPNTAEVQQMVTHEPPSIAQAIADRGKVPAPSETIPGLEDLDL